MPAPAALSPEVAHLAQELGPPPRRGFAHLFRGSLHELFHPPPNQIPFLHALRAVAALLVITLHVNDHYAELHGPNWLSRNPLISNGWIGVDLFFVLSGFFIGGQLWKELWATGSISLRRFVVRRGLRIWPLYVATFIAFFAFDPRHAAAHGYGWSDLVFLTNFVHHGVHLTGNIVQGAWSLCVEEQFYLLAPLVLLLLPRLSFRAIVLGLLALPSIRAIIWLHSAGSLHAHDPSLFFSDIYCQWHWDGLLVGLLVAHQWLRRDRPKTTHRRATLVLLAGLLVFAVLHHLQHEILTFSGLALGFGAIVWAGLTSRTTLFSHRLFYWLSRLSFGMYLNHQLLLSFVLLHVLPRLPFSGSSAMAQAFGTVLLAMLSAALAAVTFCFIEHPALNLRLLLLEPAASHPRSVRHQSPRSTAA